MEHWKRTIERANRCFMLGELVDAREAYLQALALAQVLFERLRAVMRLVGQPGRDAAAFGVGVGGGGDAVGGDP